MNVILKNFFSTQAISSKFERKIGDQMTIDGESFERARDRNLDRKKINESLNLKS